MKRTKLWFWFSNVGFVLIWLALVTRTVRHWHTASPSMHFWLADLNIIFLLLWLYLLREKNSPTCIAIAGFALLAAMRTALVSSP